MYIRTLVHPLGEEQLPGLLQPGVQEDHLHADGRLVHHVLQVVLKITIYITHTRGVESLPAVHPIKKKKYIIGYHTALLNTRF